MLRQPINILYCLVSWCGQKVIAVVERLLLSNASSTHAVPEWAPVLCQNEERILTEFLNLSDINLREFSNISPEQARITKGNSWKAFLLKAYRRPFEVNCARCPQTSALCDAVPEITSVMFSILEPGTQITPHRGPYAGVLRCHIPLIVPDGDCGIRVGKETHRWQKGKPLVFDDTIDHEAWNKSNERRVVLFIDFVRPLPQPLAAINRWVIWLMGRSPFIGRMVRASA